MRKQLLLLAMGGGACEEAAVVAGHGGWGLCINKPFYHYEAMYMYS